MKIKKQMIKKAFRKTTKIFDLDAYLPSDFGLEGSDGYPRFFELEHWLVLPSALLVLLSIGFYGMIGLEYLGVLVPVDPTISLWPISFASALLGISGFFLIFKLAHRNINEEQFKWMQDGFTKLNMSAPKRGMSKQVLKEYVEQAYKRQLQNPTYI